MGAAVDCETIGPGLLGQPVNSVTSLALVVAGAVVLSRSRDLWMSTALVATGIGSFLFHGPLAPGGEWIHDVTLAWLIAVVVVRAAERPESWAPMALMTIGVIFLAAPSLARPITGALTLVAIIAAVRGGPRRVTLPPLGLLGASAIVGRMGATDKPWCDPESVLQTHGLWHVGAATAVAWWLLGSTRIPSTDTRP